MDRRKAFGFRSKWFYRYLTASILMFLIPSILVSLFAYRVFSKRIESLMFSNNAQLVLQAQAEISNLTSDMDRIAYRISQNSALSDKTISQHVLHRNKAIQTVSNYILANHALKDVLLYYPGKSMIISSETVLATWQLKPVYGASETELGMFDRQFLEEHTQSLMPFGRYHLYIAGFHHQTSQGHAYCLFLVETNTLHRSIQVLGSQSALVDNQTGDVLRFTNQPSLLAQDQIAELYQSMHSVQTLQHVFQNQSLIVSKHHNQAGRYGVLSWMDTESLIEPLKSTVTTFMLITSLITLIAFGAIYYVSKRNYSPIKHLKETAEELLGTDHPKVNEFDIVRIAMHHLESLNESLLSDSVESKRHLRMYIMKELLNGGIKNLGDLNAKLEPLNVHLPDGELYVLLLAGEETGDTSYDAVFQEFHKSKLNLASATGFGHKLSSTRALYLFSVVDAESFSYVLRQQSIEWGELGMKAPVISISAAFDNLTATRKAFEQTLYLISKPDAYAAGLLRYESSIWEPEEIIQTSSSNLLQQLMSFLLGHYWKPEFSVQLMADAFDMPISSLSSFFRKQTGTTLMDYITRLKMEKAKELLLTTNMPLQELVLQVGYNDVSNFIRRFSRIVGLTPGAYRAKYVQMDAQEKEWN